ncbi:hypothetical protein CEV08_06840 [Bartonella tribocorum]|uniref:Uncharacterized protein n=1 Tax=Bartonella tribocorum TaxID=85701 RepID=A0A2M6USI8_9HYPH|nr:hypothetical protein CEV08_06840 [Bartonella tribocorum]
MRGGERILGRTSLVSEMQVEMKRSVWSVWGFVVKDRGREEKMLEDTCEAFVKRAGLKEENVWVRWLE